MANNAFTQQALAQDPLFRIRIREALSAIAWQVINEAPATQNHAARIEYARRVIRNLDSEVTVLAPSFVLRPNVLNFETSYAFDFQTQTGAVVSATGDADLQSQIASDWDALAAAAGFTV